MAGKPLTNSIILESTDLNRYYLNYMTMWDFRQIDMEREHIVAGGIDLVFFFATLPLHGEVAVTRGPNTRNSRA